MIALLLALLACGTERWDVKVASDAAAAEIDPTPRRATIALLRALVPPQFAVDAPRWPEERKTFTVTAFLDGFMREADGDYHVGIRDEAGRTIVVEFPAPECLDGSFLRIDALLARRALENILRVPITSSYKRLRGNTVRLQVTGVLFFDKRHGQHIGARAPSGVELHLVRGVRRLP
jgi:hypothetical protein